MLPTRCRRQGVQNDDPGKDQAKSRTGKDVEGLTEGDGTEKGCSCNATT